MSRLIILLVLGVALSGCSKEVAGGAAVGALGAGAVYEYQANQAMDQLEKEYKSGAITKDEYDRRKKEIEKHSLLQ